MPVFVSVTGEFWGGDNKECADDGSEEQGDDEAVDDGDYGEYWTMNAVLMGDGAKVGLNNLVDGVWYGTAGEPADASSYWPAECDTITMPSFGGWLVESRALPVGATERGQVFASFRVGHNKCNLCNKSGQLLQAVLGYCSSNPGLALVTAGRGCREVHGSLQRWYISGSKAPFVSTKHLDCAMESPIYGILALRGAFVAMSALEKVKTSHVHLQNLKEISPFIFRWVLVWPLADRPIESCCITIVSTPRQNGH